MKRSFKPGGVIRLVSVILSIVLTLSMMAGILIADIRLATTKENAAKIIRETLFTTQIARPVSSGGSGQAGHAAAVRPHVRLAAKKLDNGSSGIMTDVMVEWLYNNLAEQHGEEALVSIDDIEAFIEESTLKDDISGLAASLINDFVTGKNTTALDEETVRTLVNENAAVIEKHFGVAFSEEFVSGLVETITTSDYVSQLQEDGIGGLLLNAGTSDGSSGTANPVADLLTNFRKATSVGAIIACFGVALACMVALILLNLKHLWYALRKIGMALTVASLPSAVPTLVSMAAAEAFNATVAGAVIAKILQITAPLCISVFAVGVVLIVVSVVLKVQAKKNAKLADTTEELSAALVEEAPAAIEEPQESDTTEDAAEEAAEEI